MNIEDVLSLIQRALPLGDLDDFVLVIPMRVFNALGLNAELRLAEAKRLKEGKGRPALQARIFESYILPDGKKVEIWVMGDRVFNMNYDRFDYVIALKANGFSVIGSSSSLEEV